MLSTDRTPAAPCSAYSPLQYDFDKTARLRKGKVCRPHHMVLNLCVKKSTSRADFKKVLRKLEIWALCGEGFWQGRLLLASSRRDAAHMTHMCLAFG